jgi:hypothetical protein
VTATDWLIAGAILGVVIVAIAIAYELGRAGGAAR